VRPTLSFATALGVAAGLAEVALRASPLRAFDLAQVGQWALLSALCACAVTVPLALSRRCPVVAAGLSGLLVSINYRYELVLNEFVRDPRVWGGMIGTFVLGAAGGWFLSRLLTVRRLLVLAALATIAAVARSTPTRGTPSDLPSVLVVSLDTTRADAVGDKPVWSRLAREGTSFSQAIAAAPITEPSHLAMFTGLAPYKSGIVSNGTDLGEREALVWRALGERGYLTGGFVAGFPLHSKYGWAQGMDAWDDDFGAWPGAESLSIVKLYNQFFVKEHALRERPAHRVIDRAARWLRAHREETFFAFVHFYDAHGPYEAPVRPGAAAADPPTSGAILPLPAYWPARHRAITSVDYLKDAYDDEVAYVDGAMGALLDALGDRLDNTIVVVTADHGESLDEHGYLFDHGDDLYDPSLRVPLVVRYPAAVVAGLVQDCQVSGVDLAPTILDLVGIDDGHARDGLSRVPELRGEACRDTPVVASTTAGRFVANPPVDHALRGAGTKLIAKESGAVEYYELATDPGEMRNLAPGEASKAREELLRLLLRDKAATVGPEMDDATRQALEALGYVEGG